MHVKDMNIQQDIFLQDKNWFKTGGPAAWYAQPETERDMQELISFAAALKKNIVVIGQGANILISDQGIDALVICPNINYLFVNEDQNKVTAGAGVSMDDLIVFCLEKGLLGLEVFSGIPGSVGGAIFINLHYFSSLIQHYLISARVIERVTGKIIDVSTDWFEFGYNQSRLHDRNYYLISATFSLSPASQEAIAYARGRRDEIINHRKRRYPLERTCGSFFRNFFPNEVATCAGQIPHVAYYLDIVGVRRHDGSGQAMVSFQHANMIVTKPGATTADIITVARLMQRQVYAEFGIIPQPECQLLGFSSYPLLTIDEVRSHREESLHGIQP